MIAAFFKESRSLVPFWIAFAAMVVVSAVADALGPDYVLQPFGTRYDDDSGGYFFVVLLGLLMGHGVVAHEYVNDHIEFLDALPVTRTTLYLGKVLACTMAALGLVVGSALGDVTMDVLGPVPHQLPSWRPLLIEHLLVFATFWFGLGVGMLLSWIRGLAISVVIALMFAGSILTFAIPSLGDAVPLPDTGFGRLTWTRGEASHPFGPPLFWFGIGTLCMVISGWLFTGPGGALVARGSAAMSRLRVVGVVLGSVTLMGLGLLGLLATGGIADLPERLLVVDPPGPLRVVFQPSSAGHVLSMVPSLEAKLDAIAAHTGGPLPQGPLDVEFLGAQPNHEGVFTGGKVRVQPDASPNVLVHELTHAVAFERLGPAGWHQVQHTRFFGEGLANWVADEVTGDGEDPVDAFLIRATDQARFDLMVEDHRFVAEQDIVQAYPLGEVFVRALVDVAGLNAIPCTLDALDGMGRQRLAGLAIWYATAHQCNYDLDMVTARWRARLDEGVATLAELPRLRVERRFDESAASLLVVDEANTGFGLLCRFRADAEEPVDRYAQSRVDPDGRCLVPVDELLGATFDYQVGFTYGPAVLLDAPVVFLPWINDVRQTR